MSHFQIETKPNFMCRCKYPFKKHKIVCFYTPKGWLTDCAIYVSLLVCSSIVHTQIVCVVSLKQQLRCFPSSEAQKSWSKVKWNLCEKKFWAQLFILQCIPSQTEQKQICIIIINYRYISYQIFG